MTNEKLLEKIHELHIEYVNNMQKLFIGLSDKTVIPPEKPDYPYPIKLLKVRIKLHPDQKIFVNSEERYRFTHHGKEKEVLHQDVEFYCTTIEEVLNSYDPKEIINFNVESL